MEIIRKEHAGTYEYPAVRCFLKCDHVVVISGRLQAWETHCSICDPRFEKPKPHPARKKHPLAA